MISRGSRLIPPTEFYKPGNFIPFITVNFRIPPEVFNTNHIVADTHGASVNKNGTPARAHRSAGITYQEVANSSGHAVMLYHAAGSTDGATGIVYGEAVDNSFPEILIKINFNSFFILS